MTRYYEMLYGLHNYFKWKLESGLDNLPQAEELMLDHIIAETRRAMFSNNYPRMENTLKECDEIIEFFGYKAPL